MEDNRVLILKHNEFEVEVKDHAPFASEAQDVSHYDFVYGVGDQSYQQSSIHSVLVLQSEKVKQ